MKETPLAGPSASVQDEDSKSDGDANRHRAEGAAASAVGPPSALDVSCPVCRVPPGEHCLGLGRAGSIVVFHGARLPGAVAPWSLKPWCGICGRELVCPPCEEISSAPPALGSYQPLRKYKVVLAGRGGGTLVVEVRALDARDAATIATVNYGIDYTISRVEALP